MENLSYVQIVDQFSKYLLTQFEKDSDRAFYWLILHLSLNFPEFARDLSKSEPFLLRQPNMRLIASKNIEVKK